MARFQRSLAEDAVDRYNHTWGVMLLLLLSFTAWLLPLSPRIQAQQSGSTSASPVHQATCWTPAHFTGSMVAYSYAVCGNAFTKAMSGINDEDENVKLYHLHLDITGDQSPKRFQPINSQSKEERDKRIENYSYFINVTVPFALFVLAICLKLPHLVWTLLSSFMGINVRGTLESLKSSHSLDTGSRQQLKQELVSAVTEAARATSFTTSLLYLTFKALMVAAALGSLVVVRNDLLPETQSLSDESVGRPIYNGEPLVCGFHIRQFDNIRDFKVQCTFIPSDVVSASIESQAGQRETTTHLGIYETVFTVLMVFYCILTVVNILSLLSWTFKLIVGPCRKRVTSNPKLPTDMYLLLFMAQENLGNLTARELAQDAAPITGKDDEGDKLHD